MDGPPPEEWRDGIRTSRGRAHAAPFHAGPRLGRGAVAQGRVQPLPVVLVDVLFSERRDMAAAEAFFRSAKAVTGVTPDRVTTDGHDSYPRAIRSELGKGGLSGISCEGHDDGEKETLAWHDANSPRSPTSCSISCWRGPTRRRPSPRTGCWTS